MKDLHLKFKADTGNSAISYEIEGEDGFDVKIPTDEYLEWLEDLALKQLNAEVYKPIIQTK